MPTVVEDLTADLAAEHGALDERVAPLTAAEWDDPTPAEGWTVRDSISHLTYFDRTARMSVAEPEAYAAHAVSIEPGSDVALGRSLTPGALLDAWRAARHALLASVASLEPGRRLQWYGRAMSPASFLTARLMETWAHGTDVADALGLPPTVSGRLRHVIDIGVRARPFAFAVHRVEDAGTAVRVVAAAPGGGEWAWGDDGGDILSGPALDLALLFTQRRHPDDLRLEVSGETAAWWVQVAQAYAGPPGPGRAPIGRA